MVLDVIMKYLTYIVTETTVTKASLIDSVKQHSEKKNQERLDCIIECDKTNMDFSKRNVFSLMNLLLQ